MNIYRFQCKLLSDLIISSSPATEGQNQSLDYIPGAKFMGAVAKKLYKESEPSSTQDLFHIGKVRFSNAYPLGTVPVPFGWFQPKSSSDNMVYLHHNLTIAQHSNFRKDGIQLKQVRNGYFHLKTGEIQSVIQQFRLKSAYDEQAKKSMDEKMFGYFSLPQQSLWEFSVEDDSGAYEEVIIKALEGINHLGKSKSAEYGLAEIQFIRKESTDISISHSGELVLYAESDWCFLDEFGQTTTLPSPSDLCGDPSAKINWLKSQIRTKKHQSWNGKRGGRDSDRMVISKGSCIILTTSKPVSSDFFSSGLGSHKTEGFGKVSVNPNFLTGDGISKIQLVQKEINGSPYYSDLHDPKASQRVDILINRGLALDFDRQINLRVQEFIKSHRTEFKGINKSQWGTLRSYSKQFLTLDAFNTMVFGTSEIQGFLVKGKSSQQWKNPLEILQKEIQKITKEKGSDFAFAFMKKLTIEMPKSKKP
jgi:hypothetical protein